MAQVSFTKLGLAKNTDINTFEYNGQVIEVKQYLPIQDKINIINVVLNNCQENENFINDIQLQFWLDLEIIFNYTNIKFTDKQKEDNFKLYDLLTGSGLLHSVKENMNQDELNSLLNYTIKSAEHIYEYRNSAYGIFDMLVKRKDELDFDATEIQKKINDPEALAFLKSVMDKLG